jgi:hypothetical protein
MQTQKYEFARKSKRLTSREKPMGLVSFKQTNRQKSK